MIFETFSMMGLKPKSKKFQESMFKKTLKNGRVIRVWRNERTLEAHYNNYDINETINICQDYLVPDLIKAICQHSFITAVEVLDTDGNGVVYYNDW